MMTLRANIFKIVAMLVLLVQLAMIVLIPPFQFPDEQAHLRYIRVMQDTSFTQDLKILSDIALLQDDQELTDAFNASQAGMIMRNPNQRYSETLSYDIEPYYLYVFNHPPLYYAISGLILLPLKEVMSVLQLLLLSRLINIIYTLTNLYLATIAGKKLFKTLSSQVLFVLFATGWPMLTFISAGINNDALLYTSALGVFSSLVLLQKGKSLNIRSLLIFSTFGAVGLLTKAQFLPIFIPALIYLLILYHREAGFSITKKVFSLLPLVVPFIFYIYRLLLYGSFFASFPVVNSTVSDCTDQSFVSLLSNYIHPRVILVIQSFIGNFGWLDTKVHTVWFVIWGLIILISIGFALYRLLLKPTPWKVFLFSQLLILEAFYIALFVRTFAYTCNPNFPAQGRYYFLILPVISLFIVEFSTRFKIPILRLKLTYIMYFVFVLYYVIVFMELINRYYM